MGKRNALGEGKESGSCGRACAAHGGCEKLGPRFALVSVMRSRIDFFFTATKTPAGGPSYLRTSQRYKGKSREPGRVPFVRLGQPALQGLDKGGCRRENLIRRRKSETT